MKILGLQKLTLLDYPDHLAAVVFLGGCNFRCPFCQNRSLVLTPNQIQFISPDEFSAFLKRRTGMLDGICVTGGEPTLHKDLPELFRQIKDAGYLAKLDTNGTNPTMLELLIASGLIDYVAMDIKAGRENYPSVCGVPSLTIEQIEASVSILKNSSIDYEFRTTVVKGLHTEQDFLDIREWIEDSPHYYLQSFRDCDEILQQDHPFDAFSEKEMLHFLEIVQKKIPQAKLRGL